MSMQAWWPRLTQEARDWLVANNGDALPAWVTDERLRSAHVVRANTCRCVSAGAASPPPSLA